MTSTKPTPIIIFGGGKIACGKHLKDASQPLNHIEAITFVDSLYVHAIVEQSEKRQVEIARDWPAISIYKDLASTPILDNEIIAICSPPKTHLMAAREALQRRPLCVLIEKPCCQSAHEARKLLRDAKAAGVNIFVNYNRRFDARFQTLKNQYPEFPKEIHISYGRGIYNYASHFIDLILHWYGNVKSVHILKPANSTEKDPNPSFFLEMEAGFRTFFHGFDEIDYDLLDMVIWFKDKRIKLDAGGAEISIDKPVEDKFYSGYAHLESDYINVGHVGGFTGYYQALSELGKGYHSLTTCNLEMALVTHDIIEHVLDEKQFETI